LNQGMIFLLLKMTFWLMFSITNWFEIFWNHRQLRLETILKSLDQIVFHFVDHFHQSHLNQIHTWHELNLMHFHLHHFNQFWFQGMLKFLDQNVLNLVNHFHQSHLNQIQNWHELNQKHFMNHHFNQL
jgi:hypothetical protein